MLILGIESSCDETSAAVVSMGSEKKILSNVIASQIETHRLYGGVVPEIASRAHTEAISALTREALEKAVVSMDEIGAVAVTARPGLIGALLVGVNFAKSLAFANSKPLVPVNHIRGHVAANYLEYPSLEPPFLALVASGGHTSLIEVKTHTEFVTIGRTRDDAAGEAFDKVARAMGLHYPGGAEIDRLARTGDAGAVRFPSAAIAGDTLDFSFSGLKTHVVNYLHNQEQKGVEYSKADVAASLTRAVVGSIVKKLAAAAELTGLGTLAVSGGVAANSHLRAALAEFADGRGMKLCVPPLSLCGDNAAMIAAQGYYEFIAGNLAGSDLNASAN